MRRFAWIWFLGCTVWAADGIISLHYRALQHAKLAFLLALVFLAAGLLYQRQRR